MILEASVGGEAGDIAIDDISLIHGPCPDSGNKAQNSHNGTYLALFFFLSSKTAPEMLYFSFQAKCQKY